MVVFVSVVVKWAAWDVVWFGMEWDDGIIVTSHHSISIA